MNPELQTDEEIQAQLAGESLRGPRTFRGRPLAEITRNLRGLAVQACFPEDYGPFQDFILLHILAEAYAEEPSKRLERRCALLLAAGDLPIFRAKIALAMDECTEEEEKEASRLAGEILGLVKKAEAAIIEKKSSEAEPSPEAMPPISMPST